MQYKIEYSDLLDRKAVSKIPSSERKRIQSVIGSKLTHRPDSFGEPLSLSLRGYWKLRIGNYRVIYRIEGAVIKVFAIDHRSVVYERLLRKLGR
jgi:mRNA interferase RelE/StbE